MDLYSEIVTILGLVIGVLIVVLLILGLTLGVARIGVTIVYRARGELREPDFPKANEVHGDDGTEDTGGHDQTR